MNERNLFGTRRWFLRSALLILLAVAFVLVGTVLPGLAPMWANRAQAADSNIQVQIEQHYGEDGSWHETKEIQPGLTDIGTWDEPSHNGNEYDLDRVIIEKEKIPYSYQIQYFKDSAQGTLLGQKAYVGYYGDNIKLSQEQLDALRPEKYLGGLQQGSVPAVLVQQDQKISVVYLSDESLATYTIRYFKDSEQDENFLGEAAGHPARIGQMITLSATQLDAFRPKYYEAGQQRGEVPLVVSRQNEVIHVVYRPQDLSYRVRYFEDSVDGNFLGEQLGSAKYGTGVVLTQEQLDAKKPEGYRSGVQEGQIPVPLLEDRQTIDVVYALRNVNYSVQYFLEGELIAQEDYTVPYGTEVKLSQEELDRYLSEGYESGTQSGEIPARITQDGQTIEVYYEPLPPLYYVVNYYDGEISPQALFAQTTNLARVGTEVTLSSAELNLYRPHGSKEGVQQGSVPARITQDWQEIDVVYERELVHFTVDYYADGKLLGSEERWEKPGTAVTLQEEELNRYRPEGYENGEQQGSVPAIITQDEQVIEVVYEAKVPEIGYVINYYVDGAVVHSIEERAPYGTAVTLSEEELDRFLPEGYTSGVQQGAVPALLTQDGQEIKVVYDAKVLTYQIEYYRGTELAGTKTEQAPYGSKISLTREQLDLYLAEGFHSGVQLGQNPATITQQGQTIRVYYPVVKLNYEITYYKGSVAPQNSVGKVFASAQKGTQIALVEWELNRFRPQGYLTGVQQGQVPAVIERDGQQIDVVYEREMIDYRIHYMVDGVVANVVESQAPYGTSITLSQAQLDQYLPEGYTNGVQQGAVPAILTKQGQHIEVVYEKKPISYAVNYYIAGKLIQSDKKEAPYGTEIKLSQEELNRYQPEDYDSGVQQGAVPAVIAKEGQIIEVTYQPKRVFLNINYYKGEVKPENLIKSDVTLSFAWTPIKLTSAQLNKYRPYATAPGEQQGEIPFVVRSQNQTINVLYPVRTSPVTINYHYLNEQTGTRQFLERVTRDELVGSVFVVDTGILNYSKQKAEMALGKAAQDGNIAQGVDNWFIEDRPLVLDIVYFPSAARFALDTEPTQATPHEQEAEEPAQPLEQQPQQEESAPSEMEEIPLEEHAGPFLTVAYAADEAEVLSGDTLWYSFEPGYRYKVTLQHSKKAVEQAPVEPTQPVGEDTTPTPPAPPSAPVPSELPQPPDSPTPSVGHNVSDTGAVPPAAANNEPDAGNRDEGSATQREFCEAQKKETLQQLKKDNVPILNIGEMEVPLHGMGYTAVWGLLNLILAIVGSVAPLMQFAKTFGRTHGRRRMDARFFVRVVSFLAAVSATVVLILTQNMNHLMVLADGVTPFMAVLVVLQTAVAVWAKKKEQATNTGGKTPDIG